MNPNFRRWEKMLAHTNPIPPASLYIWADLSLFTLEFGGRAAYMETHPETHNDWCTCPSVEPLKKSRKISQALSQSLSVSLPPTLLHKVKNCYLHSNTSTTSINFTFAASLSLSLSTILLSFDKIV
jgi:hypothetical protein